LEQRCTGSRRAWPFRGTRFLGKRFTGSSSHYPPRIVHGSRVPAGIREVCADARRGGSTLVDRQPGHDGRHRQDGVSVPRFDGRDASPAEDVAGPRRDPSTTVHPLRSQFICGPSLAAPEGVGLVRFGARCTRLPVVRGSRAELGRLMAARRVCEASPGDASAREDQGGDRRIFGSHVGTALARADLVQRPHCGLPQPQTHASHDTRSRQGKTKGGSANFLQPAGGPQTERHGGLGEAIVANLIADTVSGRIGTLAEGRALMLEGVEPSCLKPSDTMAVPSWCTRKKMGSPGMSAARITWSVTSHTLSAAARKGLRRSRGTSPE
jgi:hypothetical protein